MDTTFNCRNFLPSLYLFFSPPACTSRFRIIELSVNCYLSNSPTPLIACKAAKGLSSRHASVVISNLPNRNARHFFLAQNNYTRNTLPLSRTYTSPRDYAVMSTRFLKCKLPIGYPCLFLVNEVTLNLTRKQSLTAQRMLRRNFARKAV